MARFKVISELDYSASAPVSFLLNVRAQEHGAQRILREEFSVTPHFPHTPATFQSTGNRFDQIRLEVPGVCHIRYEADVETHPAKFGDSRVESASASVSAKAAKAAATSAVDGPADLNLALLHCLVPSRYCQSDRLLRFAADHFGAASTPLEKVRAILAWVHDNVSYEPGSTNSQTSAVDTLVERVGVCRDFAHLSIAFCRALNIPARYVTGYAYELEPPDFHACFETWINGLWLFWDPTELFPPDGMVRIGVGRDAADVAVCTAFGALRLERKLVSCQLLDDSSQMMSPEDAGHALVAH